MPSSFFNGCNGFPSAGGETVYHFTAPCTCTYTLEYEDYYGTVSVAQRPYYWDYCDSTGYTCLTPVYIGNDRYKIDLTLDSTLSYDFLFENADSTSYLSYLIMRKPHISNISFYDITPDSISVSWDGSFDDVVIEFGPRDFTPGNDTSAGTNGTIIHNPVSPYTFTGLIPDSSYDFYFRDKCGVFSQNSIAYRKRIPDCSNLPSLNCNTMHTFILYTDTAYYAASWVMDSCGNSTHLSQEKIFTFTPDTTGIFSFEHYSGSCSNIEIGIYYKESSLGCDEHNWTCIGAGGNSYNWNASFGPLTAGTNYYIMFKSNPHYCGPIYTDFRFNCPSAACSVAPDSISSNATNNTICSGQSVTLTQIGGVLSANGAFHWYADSCGGTSLGTGYSITFSPTITTTYYVRAEDTCGVTSCTSITITVLPSPAPPTITGVTTFCQGSSSVLTASSGYSCYQWSIASTTQSINVSSPGTYTVTVCNANGCTASGSATVIVNPLPTANLAGNASVCAGNCTNLNVTFSGTGPFTYSYTNGTQNFGPFTTSVNPVIFTVCPVVTTVYTLIDVWDVYCEGIVSGIATVTVNPLPNPVISGQTAICPGSSTFLDAGAGYTSYLWILANGTVASSQVVPADTPGIYIAIVTDANGCVGSDSVTVVAVPNPVA
ncbi:MAG: hypothetical protein ABI855_17425, partial [Bacteroidota bacterium]